MIKFFRKIRQKLVTESKFNKYLLYAIGEILLVVIGIFLAIQLNDLNQNRKESNRELSFLLNLKDDINSDIVGLSQRDSILATYESSSEKALEIFYKAKTVEDILTVDSLFISIWNNIKVNRKTYDEMLNTSGIYILKNKKLLNHLSDYYTLIESLQQIIKEMNRDAQQMQLNPNLYSHNFLIQEHGKLWFDIKKIDTNWIGDFNSPTSLALHRYYKHSQRHINVGRRAMLKGIIKRSNSLIDEIEQVLNGKNYNE
jgi:hypothetical protein